MCRKLNIYVALLVCVKPHSKGAAGFDFFHSDCASFSKLNMQQDFFCRIVYVHFAIIFGLSNLVQMSRRSFFSRPVV